MNIINTKGSSDNFLNSVPLKIKGLNTIITKETVVDGLSQTTTIDGQTAYNELKTQQDTNIANISNLQNTLDQNYYTKEETEEAIASQMSDLLKQNLQFTANKAIYTGADGYVTASNNVSRFDIEMLNGLNSELAARYQTTLVERLNALLDQALEPSPKAELNKTGTVKIANNLTTSSFDPSDPVALSAYKGYDLQIQISKIAQNLTSIKNNYYNAYFSQNIKLYITVTTPSTATSDPIIGKAGIDSSGILIPWDTEQYGFIPCWKAFDRQYYKTTDWNSIILKEPGQYLFIFQAQLRPEHTEKGYSIPVTLAADSTSSNPKYEISSTNMIQLYNYISHQHSIRIKINLDRYIFGEETSLGGWELFKLNFMTISGAGAQDKGVGLAVLDTTESNLRIQLSIFSNNPFGVNYTPKGAQTRFISGGLAIIHLNTETIFNSSDTGL